MLTTSLAESGKVDLSCQSETGAISDEKQDMCIRLPLPTKLIRSCSTSTIFFKNILHNAIDGGGNSSQTTFFVAKILVGIVQQKSACYMFFLLV